MSRKDYEAIASAIRVTTLSWVIKKKLAEQISITLANDNPRFNKKLFIEACK